MSFQFSPFTENFDKVNKAGVSLSNIPVINPNNPDVISVTVATTAPLPTVTYYNGPANDGVSATLTADSIGIVTIDGRNLTLNNTVLIKDQVSQLQNGVYLVTTEGTSSVALILTRATNSDEETELDSQVVIPINGLTNKGLAWGQTSEPSIVIGTTAINYISTDSFSKHKRRIYVSLSGNDITGKPYDVNRPFRTLEAGIAACTTTTGDILYIMSGDYKSYANLAKQGITIYYENGTITTGSTNVTLTKSGTTTVTATTVNPHRFVTGNIITINDGGTNFNVTAGSITVINSTSFTYTSANTTSTSGSGSYTTHIFDLAKPNDTTAMSGTFITLGKGSFDAGNRDGIKVVNAATNQAVNISMDFKNANNTGANATCIDLPVNNTSTILSFENIVATGSTSLNINSCVNLNLNFNIIDGSGALNGLSLGTITKGLINGTKIAGNISSGKSIAVTTSFSGTINVPILSGLVDIRGVNVSSIINGSIENGAILYSSLTHNGIFNGNLTFGNRGAYLNNGIFNGNLTTDGGGNRVTLNSTIGKGALHTQTFTVNANDELLIYANSSIQTDIGLSTINFVQTGGKIIFNGVIKNSAGGSSITPSSISGGEFILNGQIISDNALSAVENDNYGLFRLSGGIFRHNSGGLLHNRYPTGIAYGIKITGGTYIGNGGDIICDYARALPIQCDTAQNYNIKLLGVNNTISTPIGKSVDWTISAAVSTSPKTSTINGFPSNFITTSTDPTVIATGLVNSINSNTNLNPLGLGEVLLASNVGGVITVVSQVAGTSFTPTVLIINTTNTMITTQDNQNQLTDVLSGQLFENSLIQ